MEDQKGYVYDKEAIELCIKQARGSMACPVMGTQHFITLALLKPCERILNKRRLEQRWGGTQKQQQAGVEAEILDA